MPFEIKMKAIATVHNDMKSKFGIPRQSGLVNELKSEIVFEKEYRNPDAFRGIQQYSHLWLIWYFSESHRDSWSPTVRPPKLGGNTRMGVFATRSPFRPNPVGMSCVKLEEVLQDEKRGTVLVVSGADIMDKTPVFDIKPYLPYCDCRTDAQNGFALSEKEGSLSVEFPERFLSMISPEKRDGVIELLSQDPRPAYQNDSGRVYVMPFSNVEIHFKVCENRLEVVDVTFI